MLISGIQYMRPDGHKSPFFTELPDELKHKVQEIHESGLTVASEVLSTGAVSLTLEHEEGDFDIAVFNNAPGVPVAKLTEMIQRFSKEKFNNWLRSMTGELTEWQ